MNDYCILLIICAIYILLSLHTGLYAANDRNGLPDYDMTIPSGKGTSPCVIICPGRGYHKELPLIKNFAKLADVSGFATVRFDWTFFTTKGKPSDDGSTEMEDIEAVLKIVKANSRIDSTRIYIAGKSLGSLLAYATFNAHQSLRGCILLTPILPSADMGEEFYPNLTYEMRPIAFILGDKDQDNCSVTELYKVLSGCARVFPVTILTGGHSFELGYDDKDPYLKQANDFNVKTAVENAVYWLKVFDYPHLNK